jgi:hypothetical protein
MRATLRKQKKFRGIVKRNLEGIKPTNSEIRFLHHLMYTRPWAYFARPRDFMEPTI